MAIQVKLFYSPSGTSAKPTSGRLEGLWQAAGSAPVQGTSSVGLGPDDSLTQWTY